MAEAFWCLVDNGETERIGGMLIPKGVLLAIMALIKNCTRGGTWVILYDNVWRLAGRGFGQATRAYVVCLAISISEQGVNRSWRG